MAPQVLQVLLCVQCKTFQVHIVKKAKKWECKVCGTKQTLVKVFGTGRGPECRNLVQQLNEARGILDTAGRNLIVDEEFPCNTNQSVQQDDNKHSAPAVPAQEEESNSCLGSSKSEWDAYQDDDSVNRLY